MVTNQRQKLHRESRVQRITPTKRIAEHQGTSENDKHGYTKCLELEEGALQKLRPNTFQIKMMRTIF